ncbi:MAG: hypothetical protein AAGG01_05655 [Planctomycetota bacterium]
MQALLWPPLRLPGLSALSALLAVVGCLGCASSSPPPAAISLLGEPLARTGPDGLAADWMQAETDAAHLAWQCDPSEMRAVWMGRRLAYMGHFEHAITWYANAIQTFPESYRLRRHMGHRLLTIRKVQDAITVLEEARALAEGRPNRLEPDGAPGPEWEPRSTTHGNIEYHLALAYYLSGEWKKAAQAWDTCANRWARTGDERVAATHWLYMSLIRLGERSSADAAVQRLPADLDVLENEAYADLVRLYRGEAQLGDLMGREERSAALDYGLARWLMDHGDEEAGQALLEDLAGRSGWTAFGVLAAESDVARQRAETR